MSGMTTFQTALRKKFRSPRDVLAALGLDQELLVSDDQDEKRRRERRSVARVLAATPAFQLAYDQAMTEQRPIMNGAAAIRLTEFLKGKLDTAAMAALTAEIQRWVPDHTQSAEAEAEGEDNLPETALRAGPGGRLAEPVDRFAPQAMDARGFGADYPVDAMTRRLAKKYPGVENIVSTWRRDG